MQLSSLNKLTIYGPQPSRGRAALCSFNVEGLHATDISTLLDQEGKLVSVQNLIADFTSGCAIVSRSLDLLDHHQQHICFPVVHVRSQLSSMCHWKLIKCR